MAKIDKIISHIPDWIAMSHDTSSNGYKFLESFGLELDDVEDIMNELQESLYIASANVETPDYLHKVHLEQLDDYSLVDLVVESNITVVDSIYKLFTATAMVGMFDQENSTFYINNYDSSNVRIEIYKARLDSNLEPMLDSDGNLTKGDLLTSSNEAPILHHVWNCFDEFALLLGLKRLTGETNYDLRKRITSAIVNPPGSNSSGLQVGIARDFGISSEEVNLKTLEDIEIYDEEDNLSSTFLNYINMLKNIKPLTIARWDSEIIDNAIYSVHYVPRIYNNILDQIPDVYIQSGVGDNDDLRVLQPSKDSYVQEYNTYIGLTADRTLSSTYFPRHEFKVIVDAAGIKMNKMFKPKDINFSILAAENKDVIFTLTATQNFTTKLKKTFESLGVVISNPSNEPMPAATGIPSKSDSVYIVPSNTLFHGKSQYIRVKIDLKSNATKTLAPTIKQMTINYKTATTTESVVVPLDEAQDNVKNDTTDGSGNTILTIQKGEYHKIFAEREDFVLQGTTDEHLLIGSSIGIYLPRMV